MRQILYLIQKEFRQIIRDKSMIGILFIVPFIQLVVIGNAITTDVKNLKVVVYDNDRSPAAREFISHFRSSSYFRIVGVEEDYRTLTTWLDRAEANIVIAIPSGFQKALVRQESPAIQILLDGLDGNTAGIALGYVSEIARRYQIRVVADDVRFASLLRNRKGVKAETRYWYNPNLTSKNYIIPGLFALILTIITVFLTGMGIVKEKEVGTLEQLMVTPIRAYQLIIGKTVPFAILGLIQVGIAMIFVYALFGIGIQGSIPLLFFEALLFILTTLGLGIFISTISETQQQALFIAWFFMIFGILLSGFFIPIKNMPEIIQYLTYLNPLRYFLIILREIYLKGTPLQHLIPETLAMSALAMAMFGLATIRFHNKLK